MKLKERVRAKTPRLNGRSLSAIVADVNPSLRGWYGYFQHSHRTGFRDGGWVGATAAAELLRNGEMDRAGMGSRPSTLAE